MTLYPIQTLLTANISQVDSSLGTPAPDQGPLPSQSEREKGAKRKTGGEKEKWRE